jgi:Tol biopolymer transport system component
VLYEASDNRSTDLYFTYADASARAFLNPNPAVDRAPHPSPDRQWVAFLSNRLADHQYEIYVTDAAGSRAERLTNLAPGSPRWTGEMAWSPDSRRLVAVLDHPDPDVHFEVVRGDRADESGHYRGQWEGRLYLIDRDSTHMEAITPPDLLAWNPAWSPDGQRIYFNALKNGYARLMSIRLDGSGLNAINEVDDSREQAGFSFSPDGKFLAYLALSRTRGTYSPDHLQLLDMESNRKQVLKTMPNTDDIDLSLAARFATLQWSPDGQRLVYAIPKADGQANLKLLEIQRDPNLPGMLNAGAESVLFVGIDLYFPGHAPAWSLDSRSLAYLQGRRVYIISAHADGDGDGGSEIMEIYTGKRDEVGAGWLSWFD